MLLWSAHARRMLRTLHNSFLVAQTIKFCSVFLHCHVDSLFATELRAQSTCSEKDVLFF